MTEAAMIARIAELESNLAKAKNKSRAGKLTLKVSKKRAVSVYGLGKWPVTLYPEQFASLLAISDEIKAFIEAHKADLAFKHAEEIDATEQVSA